MSIQPYAGLEISPRRRFYLHLDRLLMTQEALKNPQMSIQARMARNLRHVFVEGARFPVAVSVIDGRYSLLVNLEVMKDMTFEDFRVYISHEMRHIEMHDIPRMIRMARMYPEDERKMRTRYILNPASDFAVNSQIRRANPHIKTMEGAFPDRYDLPWDRSSEEYVDMLEALLDEAINTASMKMKEVIDELKRQAEEEQEETDDDGAGETGSDSDEDGASEDQEGDGDDQEGDGDPETEEDSDGDGSDEDSSGEGEESPEGDGTPGDDREDETGDGGDCEGDGDDQEGDDGAERDESPGGQGDGEGGDDEDGDGSGDDEEDSGEQGVWPIGREQDPLGDGKDLPDQIREILEAGNWQHENADHPWQDFVDTLTPAEADIIDATLQQMGHSLTLDAAMEHKKMHGTVPGNYQQMINALFKEWKTPWQQLLRQFVRARLKAKSQQTMTKTHRRRYIFRPNVTSGPMTKRVVPKFPGKKTSRKYSVLWCTDTSGSMSEKDIMDGLSELRGMLKTMPDLTVFVLQADTRIDDIAQLDEETDLHRYVELGVKGRGGTHFEDPLQLAKATWTKKDYPDLSEENMKLALEIPPVDVLIYSTDGYAPAPGLAVKPPGGLIWLLTSHGKSQSAWEKEIHYGMVISQAD